MLRWICAFPSLSLPPSCPIYTSSGYIFCNILYIFILILLAQILVSIWITRVCVPHLAAVWLLTSVQHCFISPIVKVSSLSFQYWLSLILTAMKSIVSLRATAAPSTPCPPPMAEGTLTKSMEFYHLPAVGFMSYIECYTPQILTMMCTPWGWSSFSSVQFSCSAMSDSLQPHGLQHARPPCPSPTPGVYSNSCPLSRWCHLTISFSVVPFSSRLQSSHQVAKVLEFQLQHQSFQ